MLLFFPLLLFFLLLIFLLLLFRDADAVALPTASLQVPPMKN